VPSRAVTGRGLVLDRSRRNPKNGAIAFLHQAHAQSGRSSDRPRGRCPRRCARRPPLLHPLQGLIGSAASPTGAATLGSCHQPCYKRGSPALLPWPLPPSIATLPSVCRAGDCHPCVELRHRAWRSDPRAAVADRLNHRPWPGDAGQPMSLWAPPPPSAPPQQLAPPPPLAQQRPLAQPERRPHPVAGVPVISQKRYLQRFRSWPVAGIAASCCAASSVWQ
jgi:hypothetical protein